MPTRNLLSIDTRLIKSTTKCDALSEGIKLCLAVSRINESGLVGGRENVTPADTMKFTNLHELHFS